MDRALLLLLLGSVALATTLRLFMAYMCTHLIRNVLFGCSRANGCMQCENMTIVPGTRKQISNCRLMC